MPGVAERTFPLIQSESGFVHYVTRFHEKKFDEHKDAFTERFR